MHVAHLAQSLSPKTRDAVFRKRYAARGQGLEHLLHNHTLGNWVGSYVGGITMLVKRHRIRHAWYVSTFACLAWCQDHLSAKDHQARAAQSESASKPSPLPYLQLAEYCFCIMHGMHCCQLNFFTVHHTRRALLKAHHLTNASSAQFLTTAYEHKQVCGY